MPDPIPANPTPGEPDLANPGLGDPSPADTVFSPATRHAQHRFGSDRLMARKAFRTAITDELAAFVAERDSLYVATASAAGQPYVQHRGGPPGFLRVLGPTRLAFADFRGNQQYITTGNLSENPLCQLFLMDYLERQRVKLWGRARFSADPALIAQLMPDAYPARPLQAFVFDLAAWDGNCTSHIPRRIDAIAVARRIASLKDRIAELERENFDLHARLHGRDDPGRQARPGSPSAAHSSVPGGPPDPPASPPPLPIPAPQAAHRTLRPAPPDRREPRPFDPDSQVEGSKG